MKRIQITTPGIRKALSKYKWVDAIAEYIWNGFDAQASCVDISFSSNVIGTISQIVIRDNGYGIPYDKLAVKFIPFFESDKEIDVLSKVQTSAVHGKNGVGRLTFFRFAMSAKWTTVYRDENNKCKKYEIFVDSESLNTYSNTTPVNTEELPGTLVELTGITQITDANLDKELKPFLMREFGWFLELNRAKGFVLKFNGKDLDYSGIIGERSVFSLHHEESDKLFEVTYVRWNDTINNEYSRYYYLNSDNKELFKEHTTLNNKGDHFYHSVFIKSSYFDEFDIRDNDTRQFELFGKSRRSEEFKFLMEKVDAFLRQKRKPFLRLYTDKLITDFEDNKAFPVYNNKNLWERTRRVELENVVRELYQVEPKIFSNLNIEQKKTFVRLLDLIIDAGEVAKILQIINEIVDLDPSEREELAQLLQTSSLQAIISTIKLIEDRYKAIDEIKSLVFNKTLAANERDHLQKAIEKHYWLFGEQYHLVTAAEPKFEEALRRYIYILRGEKATVSIKHKNKSKEMDIFAVRQDMPNDVIKNIVVELKHPSVDLGKKEYDQVNGYLEIILKQDEFNAPNMFWEFYLVGNGFDTSGYIERLFDNAKNHGEKSLAFKADRYKIYIKKWSEIFTEFELRHRFLNEKLGLERDRLANGINADDIIKSLNNNTAKQPSEVLVPKTK